MKILIVDDSSTMRKIIIRNIRQTEIPDIEITEAVDGVDALAKIDEEEPSIVLCDWNMPNKSGIEVLRDLRESGNNVLFGFITSESTKVMRDAAEEAGAQFYITKPFTSDKFVDQLQKVMN